MTDKERLILAENIKNRMVAENIKNRREALGITQTELAEKMGLKDKSSISKIESGKYPITLKTVERVAAALNCSELLLMGWDQSPEPLVMEISEKESTSGKKYYFDDETAEIAEELFQDRNLRALFDAARGTTPKEMRIAAEMLEHFKESNPNG